jgi:hypothetical protein
MEVGKIRDADAPASASDRRLAITRSFPAGTAIANSANQRIVDANTDANANADDAGDTIVPAVYPAHSASRGDGIGSAIIDDPRPHAVGEAGHCGGADRRRNSLEVSTRQHCGGLIALRSLLFALAGGRHEHLLGYRNILTV